MTHLKRLWCWERLKLGGEGDNRGWDGWMASPGFGWTLGVGDGQGGLACCSSWARKESYTTEWLNWTELPFPKSISWLGGVRIQVFTKLPRSLLLGGYESSLRTVSIIFVLGCLGVWLLATPWYVACQAPLSMGFFRQEYWSGLPFPPPGDLPDPGIKPSSSASPALQADSLPAEPLGKPQASHLAFYSPISSFNFGFWLYITSIYKHL